MQDQAYVITQEDVAEALALDAAANELLLEVLHYFRSQVAPDDVAGQLAHEAQRRAMACLDAATSAAIYTPLEAVFDAMGIEYE